MIKVKICGLKREEDIAIVNELKPDYIGFVFADSKRKVDAETAKLLREKLNTDISAVGVFVDEDPERIRHLCSENIIQLVQLHGDESREYVESLKKMIPETPIIKAVRVKTKIQILEAQTFSCDYLLLDTNVKGVYGGSGTVFDKGIIPVLEKPYFLAGGLDSENVIENIQSCHPFAVDVSSAVETNGVKDAEKIKVFLERIKEHE